MMTAVFTVSDDIAVLGVLIAILGTFVTAYLGWRAVWTARLVISAGEDGLIRTGVQDLIAVQAGDKIETIDGRDIGFITDLAPKWINERKRALPITRTIFIENRGRRTAKRAALYLQTEGNSYRIAVAGGRNTKTLPAKSFVRRPLDPRHIQVKEIGDIRPGLKSPVELVFHFEMLEKVEEAHRQEEGFPVILHDYYLSEEDNRANGKIMWINLHLPESKVQTPR